MTSKKEEENPLDIKAEIDYLRKFIEVVEGWADQAHMDEARELEAPCRAAVHHTRDILNLFLSVHNKVVEELAAEELSMEKYLTRIKDQL